MFEVNYPSYVAVIVDTGCVFEVNPPIYIEEAARGIIQKKVFLKISSNSQENTCARVSF